MKKSRSQEVLETLANRTRPGTKKFFHQEEFQTQQSVYEYYQKSRTKEDVYRSKIEQSQKKLTQILAKYSNQIEQQKIQIKRLAQKHKQQCQKSRNIIILCKNQIEEVQNTVEYFVYKLRDHHEAQTKKVNKFYKATLEQLQNRLKQQKKRRKILQQEIRQKKQSHKLHKQELKQLITNHALFQNKMNHIRQSIQNACTNFKLAVEQNKIQRQKDYQLARQYIIELNKTLSDYIEEQKAVRQINKEQILQSFQRFVLNTNLNMR